MSFNAEAWTRKAQALLDEHQPLAAARCLDYAEQLGADANECAGKRWTCYMLAGAYEQAWQQSDALRRCNAPDPHRVWDGTAIAGKRVMVRSVHGLGDAVQMLRYMPMLAQQATRTTLQVVPELVGLARCVAEIDEVVAWEQERPFDVQLEITELPYLFRSTLLTLPAQVPYLALPLDRSAALRESDRARIGLVWTSSAWDPSRSIPAPSLQPILRARPDADFWCLQPTATSNEWDALCGAIGKTSRRAGDFPLTTFAAWVRSMDLVISIDSFAVHLAGALARPVWVLLKYHADWRWMTHRQDSPWYPTMRLFRQHADGAWGALIERVAAELTLWQPAGR